MDIIYSYAYCPIYKCVKAFENRSKLGCHYENNYYLFTTNNKIIVTDNIDKPGTVLTDKYNDIVDMSVFNNCIFIARTDNKLDILYLDGTLKFQCFNNTKTYPIITFDNYIYCGDKLCFDNKLQVVCLKKQSQNEKLYDHINIITNTLRTNKINNFIITPTHIIYFKCNFVFQAKIIAYDYENQSDLFLIK